MAFSLPVLRHVHSGQALYPDKNGIYPVLGHLEAGLILDVGAAAGGITKLMIQANPDSRVFCYEPFPGNWSLLEAAGEMYPQITIDKRAASDTNGHSRLFVSATVQGNEEGWEDKVGYSSAGTLVSEADARFENAIDVETVRLDSLHDEAVRLLKIDVQGAELAVLHGASGLLDRGLVDLLWVEFTGEHEILAFMRERNYEVFDSQYLLIPRDQPPGDDWDVVGTTNLSNGRKAYYAWPTDYPRHDDAYCDWFAEQRKHFVIQTDLTMVRRDMLPDFLVAAGQAL